jgi:hypothetical protein
MFPSHDYTTIQLRKYKEELEKHVLILHGEGKINDITEDKIYIALYTADNKYCGLVVMEDLPIDVNFIEFSKEEQVNFEGEYKKHSGDVISLKFKSIKSVL